jgi:hypothetical protein
MKRALVVLALVSFTGCESAAKHPAITIGAVTGTMGFGLCALSVGDVGTCGIIGGSAALVLGGITALVTLLANTNEQDEPGIQNDQPGARDEVTAPPPGLPAWMRSDAGVPQPMTQSDAGVDAAAVDGM